MVQAQYDPERYARSMEHALHVVSLNTDEETLRRIMVTFVGGYNGQDFVTDRDGFELHYTGPNSEPWTVGHLSHEPRLVIDLSRPEHYIRALRIFGEVLLRHVRTLAHYPVGGVYETTEFEWLHIISELKRFDSRAEPVSFRRRTA